MSRKATSIPLSRVLDVARSDRGYVVQPEKRATRNLGQFSVTIEQIAKDFGVHRIMLQTWLQRAAVDDGAKPGRTRTEAAELREARKRIRLLE